MITPRKRRRRIQPDSIVLGVRVVAVLAFLIIYLASRDGSVLNYLILLAKGLDNP